MNQGLTLMNSNESTFESGRLFLLLLLVLLRSDSLLTRLLVDKMCISERRRKGKPAKMSSLNNAIKQKKEGENKRLNL